MSEKRKNTFSFEVKEEIISFDFQKIDLKILVSAFLKNNVVFSISNIGLRWEITSQMPKIIRFLYSSISKFEKIEKEFLFSEQKSLNGNKTYKMVISSNINNLEKTFELNDLNFILEKEEFKKAFLAGIFLSGGSVNSPLSKTYHLELRVRNKILATFLIDCLKSFRLEPKILEKNNKIIVYLKKSENISDFLKLVNAKEAMFVFEDSRINKDYVNQLHRLHNLDVSNVRKTVEASGEIIMQINWIIKNERIFSDFSEKEKIFCYARLDFPELSLSEISKYILDEKKIEISKSALNHYSRKIKKIYYENLGLTDG